MKKSYMEGGKPGSLKCRRAAGRAGAEMMLIKNQDVGASRLSSVAKMSSGSTKK